MTIYTNACTKNNLLLSHCAVACGCNATTRAVDLVLLCYGVLQYQLQRAGQGTSLVTVGKSLAYFTWTLPFADLERRYISYNTRARYIRIPLDTQLSTNSRHLGGKGGVTTTVKPLKSN